MKIRYSYALLKYIHDAVTGEFAVVGVLLYAPEASHIAFKGSPESYGISYCVGYRRLRTVISRWIMYLFCSRQCALISR